MRNEKKINILLFGLLFFCLSTNSVYAESAKEYFERGDEHFKKSEYEKGISDYKEALELGPDHQNASVYYNLGIGYGVLGNHEEAVLNLKKAVELNPDDADAYYSLGSSYGALGNHEEAAVNLKKAVELNPDDADARFNLGLTYFYLKKYDVAEETLQQAKVLFEKTGDTDSAREVDEMLNELLITKNSSGGIKDTNRDDLPEETLIDKDALRDIAKEMHENGHLDKELTEAEIELLSKYPDRAEKLKKIADYAKVEAENVRKKNADAPQDAYRHVLWSYLLTKEYGPAFARKVTDAHEIGDDTNTVAEHEMDYNNNAVGRDYALKGFKESEILGRVLEDPRVIRSPKKPTERVRQRGVTR